MKKYDAYTVSVSCDENDPQDQLNASLHRAIDRYRKDEIEDLIKLGANVNATKKTMYGNLCPLMFAIEKSQFLTAIKLLNAGANPNVTRYMQAEHGSLTPLKFASLQAGEIGAFKLCKTLIQYGADINLMDSSKISPLEYAISKNNIHAVMLVIQLGANLDIGRFNIEKALSMAKANNHIEMTAIFENLLLQKSAESTGKDSEKPSTYTTKRQRL